MNTKIYSIFPACGKTWLYEHQEDYDLKILDSDSSQFSWMYRKRTKEELEAAKKEWESVPHLLDSKGYIDKIKDEIIKVRNPDFPNNYIKHIKENMGKYDCIFVSSHSSVRGALDKDGIDFTIVYPEHRCKAEWVGRCFIREQKGESGCGAKVMYDNFDQWVSECFETGIGHKEIVLGPTEYLSEYLIEDCIESKAYNLFEEKYNEWQRNYLGKWVGLESFKTDYPSCCDGCSNNPKNGGSGICNCALPYMQNPTIYSSNASVDDCCMTATTSTGAYIFGKEKPNADKQPKADAKRIAEAVARTKKYERK